MNELDFIEPLKMWVQDSMPSVFDDSLTFLQAQGRILAKLNETIDTMNGITNKIKDTILTQFTNWINGTEGKAWFSDMTNKLELQIAECKDKATELQTEYETKVNEINTTFTTKVNEINASFDTKVSEMNQKVVDSEIALNTKIDGNKTSTDETISNTRLSIGNSTNYIEWLDRKCKLANKGAKDLFASDDIAIKELISENEGKAIFIPNGKYLIVNPINASVGQWFIIDTAVTLYAQGTYRWVTTYYSEYLVDGLIPNYASLGGTIVNMDVGGRIRVGDSRAWQENYRYASEILPLFNAKSRTGFTAISGASQSVDNTDTESMACIGLAGLGVNNNSTKPKPVWAQYLETRRYKDSGPSFGVEIGVGAYDEDSKSITPFSNISPYSKDYAHLVNLWMSSGLESTNQHNASAVMVVLPTTGKWEKGIVFRDGAFSGVLNDAFELAIKQNIRWFFPDTALDNMRPKPFINGTSIQLASENADDTPTIWSLSRGVGTPPGYKALVVCGFGDNTGTPIDLGGMEVVQGNVGNGILKLYCRNNEGQKVSLNFGEEENTLVPSMDKVIDIGTDSKRISDVYVDTLHANNVETGGSTSGVSSTIAKDITIAPGNTCTIHVEYNKTGVLCVLCGNVVNYDGSAITTANVFVPKAKQNAPLMMRELDTGIVKSGAMINSNGQIIVPTGVLTTGKSYTYNFSYLGIL